MIIKQLFNKFLFASLTISSALSLSSCKDDDNNATPTQAKVMVIHASPSAPGVDLLVDNSKVNTAPLIFPNNTGYLNVNAGSRNFKVNVARTSTTAIEANQVVEANMNYSILLSTLMPLALLLNHWCSWII